mgnify:CR=1 FL=1
MKNSIRLSKETIGLIYKLTKNIFGKNARVWIFGSRANPKLLGGDIDIYIETENLKNIFEKRIKFLITLKDQIGDQKIDLVIKRFDDKSTIAKEAKENGKEIKLKKDLVR